jgi:hypothetical protein
MADIIISMQINAKIRPILKAYFDDSSDNEMKEFVCCGGIVADDFMTAVLENYWAKATENLKEPFRSTECECQFGQFRSWKKVDCDALMIRLVDIFCDEHFHTGTFASVVPIDMYREVFPNSERKDPFRLSVRHAIVNMARLATKHDLRVQLCFENGQEADVRRAYSELDQCQEWNPLERITLAGLSIGDKNCFALQAADFVAREGYKMAKNYGFRPYRKPVMRMLRRTAMNVWGMDCLRKFKAAGGLNNPAAITKLGEACYVRHLYEDATTSFRQWPSFLIK